MRMSESCTYFPIIDSKIDTVEDANLAITHARRSADDIDVSLDLSLLRSGSEVPK